MRTKLLIEFVCLKSTQARPPVAQWQSPRFDSGWCQFDSDPGHISRRHRRLIDIGVLSGRYQNKGVQTRMVRGAAVNRVSNGPQRFDSSRTHFDL